MRRARSALLPLALAMALVATLPATAQDETDHGVDADGTRAPDGAEAPEVIPLVSVEADVDTALDLVEAGADVVDVDDVNDEVLVVLDDHSRQAVAERGLSYEVIDADVNVFPETPDLGFQPFSTHDERTDYRYLEDYEDELEQLAEEYPDLTELTTVGESIEGRPIQQLEISSEPGVDDGRPEHTHMALLHAREWPSGELALDLAWYLLENHGSDDRVSDIIDSVRTFVMPVTNPDGFDHSRTTQPMWRGNRNPDGMVDNNRNFAYFWGGPGSSGNPGAATYRGVAPQSEPETQAIVDHYAQRHPITMLTGHTHGGWWLFPWGHKLDDPPDQQLYDLAEASVEWSGYIDGPTAQVLYQASGDTTDWAYGTFRSLAFTPEYGTTGSFHPPYLGVSSPSVTTDERDIAANYLSGSIDVDGQTGTLVDCGLAIPGVEECPEGETEGAIALIERGADTFANKALHAVEAGAVAAVIYNNTGGQVNGTLGGVAVPVPVVGIPRADGLDLLEDGPVEATLDESLSDSYADLWEVQLPAFLLNIEAAADEAAVIDASVSDTDGAPLAADLTLELERRSVTAGGDELLHDHVTTATTDDDGTIAWSVLPSDQPELDTPPYTLTAGADGYHSTSTDVSLPDFRSTATVDLELQEVAAVRSEHQLEAVMRRSTLPFRFQTLDADGSPTDVDDVSLSVVDADDGTVVHTYEEGPREVRSQGDGRYHVDVDTGQLGLEPGPYDLVVTFHLDGQEHTVSRTMTVVAPGR